MLGSELAILKTIPFNKIDIHVLIVYILIVVVVVMVVAVVVDVW